MQLHRAIKGRQWLSVTWLSVMSPGVCSGTSAGAVAVRWTHGWAHTHSLHSELQLWLCHRSVKLLTDLKGTTAERPSQPFTLYTARDPVIWLRLLNWRDNLRLSCVCFSVGVCVCFFFFFNFPHHVLICAEWSHTRAHTHKVFSDTDSHTFPIWRTKCVTGSSCI